MKRAHSLLLLLLICCAVAADAAAAGPAPPPEFTHTRPSEWLNSDPLTLASLKGKVVLVEFWAFECVNCLNSRAWIDSLIRDKGDKGLVVISVHTPELDAEKSPGGVRKAVEKLGMHNPIGRDGLLYGSVPGEMHSGDQRAQKVETALDQLLAASKP
jgi:thiol-disulfide isomerase/thioredoxin